MSSVVVIPVYNESATLRRLAEGIAQHIGQQDYRILFINDGSTDNSQSVIEELSQADLRVEYIRFSRNAGKTEALAAAFRRVQADIVVTMDADLQDDPCELPRLFEALAAGADMVCGWKQDRQDPFHKTGPSKVFNFTIAALFGMKLHDVNTGFKIMRGEIPARLPMTEGMHRFIPVLAKQLGYRVAEIPVRHHPRRHGHSKYGWERYYEGLRDALWLLSHPAGKREGLPPEPDGLVAEVHMAALSEE